MAFNPDPSKQAIEVLFSQKRTEVNHQPLSFNNQIVMERSHHKHLGLTLDKKLTFQYHLKEKLAKANKGIGVIKRLHSIVPRPTLLLIYKMFVRPHIDYADVIYDHPNNELFKKRLESMQYNAALAITGCIRGSSMDKIFNELGLEYLADRRWLRRLSLFYKISKGSCPSYLSKIVTLNQPTYNVRNPVEIRQINARTDLFRFSFFPYCIKEWNNLDSSIRNSKSVDIFRNSLLKFLRPKGFSVYGIHNPLGLKLLVRLRVGLSHLREHKFRHNFRDTLNPLCSCNIEPESTSHYLLRCHFFVAHRKKFFDSLNNIDQCLIKLTVNELTNIALYGSDIFDFDKNRKILTATILYLIESERFNEQLL